MPLPSDTSLRAYSHPKITREAFLVELQWHQDQDRIIAGSYEQYSDKTFRGCAVGCSLHSVKKIAKIKGRFSYGNHAQYPVYLGIPQTLARLQDRIFEGLASPLQAAFPMRFSSAIQTGADLSGVANKFMARMLREVALPAVKEKYSDVRTAVARVATGLETGWVNDTPLAARDASGKARAYAAAYADAAAYAAAFAAAAAYACSRGQLAFKTMANILCEELAAAPVLEAV